MKEGIYEESNQRCQYVQYISHFCMPNVWLKFNRWCFESLG